MYQFEGGDDAYLAADSTAQQQIVCVINRIATASKIEKNLRDTALLEKYLRDELDVQIENMIRTLCSHHVQTITRYNLGAYE